MLTGALIGIFEKYKNAGAHAFSSGAVIDQDKDIYQEIFSTLAESAERSIDTPHFKPWFEVSTARFSRSGGIQGQRPKDLWASVINIESKDFGKIPQIYVIASTSGLEIGFSAAIHESNYYNNEIKQRNRSIVPLLYAKLPQANSDVVRGLDAHLSAEGGWQFAIKNREGPIQSFKSLAELIGFLKTPGSTVQGGGSIYRTITPAQLNSSIFDLDAAFSRAVVLFAPLMRLLAPDNREQIRLADQSIVDHAANALPDFDPASLADGRKKILQSVAVRQGQAKFREILMEAYSSACAVTGTSVPATLQAEHIKPYWGTETNHVQNGLLLRADIHNLFDLDLIQINADTFEITVAEELKLSFYGKLQGRKLRLPKLKQMWPSKAALLDHAKLLA